MTIIRNQLVAAMMGLSVAAIASPALAQGDVSPQRAAAIEKCIAEAHKVVPQAGTAEGEAMSIRTSVYRACMQKAGQRP